MSEMWSHPWVATVLAAAVRGAPLILIAGVAVIGWRRSSAAARHLVWLVAIVSTLALPMLSASLPAWRVAVLPPPDPALTTEQTTVTQPEPTSTPTVRNLLADVPSAPVELNAAAIEATAPRDWGRIAFFLWCFGAALVALPMVVGHARVWNLSRTARPATGSAWGALASTLPHSLGLAGRVRIMVSERATMPMAFGIVNPTVLLPADAERWPLERRRDVMLHELAHVRRRDCLTQLLAQAACALYWFDPLVWLAARTLRVERERACDDAVVRAGARPSEYATHLLQVARDLRVPRSASLATVCMARRSQLSERLLAILDERRNRHTVSRRFAVPAWLIAIAIVIPASAFVPSRTLGTLPIIVSAIVPSEAIVAEQKPKRARAKRPVTKAEVAPPFTIADLLGQQTECDYSRKGNTSISHNDDDGKETLRAHISAGDCDLTIRMIGKVRFTDDLSDVKSVLSGGSLIVTESDAVTTRRIEIRSDDGRITRKFTVDGVERPWDDEGRRWLATTLLTLERRTALMADTRVPALYREGGVDAVFREVGSLSGDYARRRYFEVLFKTTPSLSESDTRRALEVAGAMESDFELAETLIAIGKIGQLGGNSTPYLRAVKNIESDYETRRVITALLKSTTPDIEAMALLLDLADNIESDFELAELLLSLSGRGLSSRESRDAFFKAVSTIESDFERRRVLTSILKNSDSAEDVQTRLLQSASTIASDFELAEFLVAFARKYPDMNAATHEAFMKTADSIETEHEYGRVMQSFRGRARRTSGMF
jgi:beta-lactamase regulating signal transducer with metallopeptidase domain